MPSIFTAGLALAVALALPQTVAAAAARTDPAQIQAAAEQFVAGLGAAGTRVHGTAGHLDPRLALAACAGELTPFLPQGAQVRSRTTVGVRCADPGGWSIYVPVTVESETELVVARRALGRGEIPAPADLALATRRVPGLPTQFVTRVADTTGRRLRRPIAAEEPLPIAALEAPVLVRRGQQVTVQATPAGVAVRAAAVALEQGGFGDWIRVRNAVSGKVIEGAVQADGTVAIPP